MPKNMMDRIDLLAPGKINLHLRVLDRKLHSRPDGFHGIESVFQLISLADRISVSITDDISSSKVVSPLMQLPPANTITAAVDRFRTHTGIKAGIRVEVEKLVPSGAGLGGGSSDAATVLRGLDTLFETRLSFAVLLDMAAGIGSDVPFFLSGGAAVVLGRGEIVLPLVSRTDLYGVLLSPAVHSSTTEAYALVDRWQEDGRERTIVWPDVSELDRMYALPLSQWQFGNSFTDPLVAVYPEIGRAVEDMRNCGADFVQMSGSGSSVFGLFNDDARCDAAVEQLSSRWRQCVKFLLLAS